MREALPLRIRSLLGAAGLVGASAVAVLAVEYGSGTFDPGYELEAVFSSSSQGLYDGSDVKVRGVNVGTVEGIELDERGRAVVTLFLHPDVEIPQGSTAAIEPLSVFGPKYVRITPPEGAAPVLAEGDSIEETVDPVEFTLVLSDATRLLEAIDPRDLTTITGTLADALGGMGPTLSRSVDDGEVALGSFEDALPSTARLLRDLATVTRTLDAHGDDLVATAGHLRRVLPDVTARADDLGSLLDRTSVLAADLAAVLRANADPLDAALRGLDPLADLLSTRRDDVIALVRMLDTQFGLLGDVIDVDADDGTLMAATRGNFGNELCDVFASLPCVPLGPPPPGGGPAPSEPDGPAAPGPLPLPPLPQPDPGLLDILGLEDLL